MESAPRATRFSVGQPLPKNGAKITRKNNIGTGKRGRNNTNNSEPPKSKPLSAVALPFSLPSASISNQMKKCIQEYDEKLKKTTTGGKRRNRKTKKRSRRSRW